MNKGLVSTTVLTIMTLIGLGLASYGVYTNYNIHPTVVVPTVTTVLTRAMPINPPTDMSSTPPKKVKQLNLTNKNVISIYGEIGFDAYYVSKKITQLGNTGQPIYILINSPGGSVLDGALIVSAIEASLVPVYTICEALCASMAFIIHQYGHKRMMVDRSILMGHPASGGVSGTLEQMQSRLGTIHRYVNKFNSYIANRAGLTLNQYLPLVVSEMWIDAEDATTRHFNDEIVNVKLPMVPPLGEITIMEKRHNFVKEKMDIRW